MIEKIKLKRGQFLLYGFSNLSIDDLVEAHIKNSTISDEERNPIEVCHLTVIPRIYLIPLTGKG